MSEITSGEGTPEKTTSGEETSVTNTTPTEAEKISKEFAEYREAQAKARDEIRANSEKRFFKEGASKVENELRTRLGIDTGLTGEELFNAVEAKLGQETQEKAKEVESTIKTSYEQRLNTLEAALAAKDNELKSFHSKIEADTKYNKVKSFANNILSTGEYRLSENAAINEKRLESAIQLAKGLSVDYSGVEPVILGDDGFPQYDVTGKKVTLKSKLDETLNVFFDKKPKQDEKLTLLNGESKKVQVNTSIADIDAQLRQAKSAEEYSTLLATKEKLINTKN